MVILLTVEEYLKNKNKKSSTTSKNYSWLSKLMITILLTISSLIILKVKPEYKTNFYKYVFSDQISFVQINELYEKYLKDVLPLNDILKVEPVFTEQLTYSNISKYKDGNSLTVSSSYLVPILDSGMVIYTGEKEDYGLTVIIEQIDGTEVWYSNLKNYNVKLYDYVEKGTLLGEVDNELYIVIKKDGKYLDYEEVF